jgi:hypothetical protein
VRAAGIPVDLNGDKEGTGIPKASAAPEIGQFGMLLKSKFSPGIKSSPKGRVKIGACYKLESWSASSRVLS